MTHNDYKNMPLHTSIKPRDIKINDEYLILKSYLRVKIMNRGKKFGVVEVHSGKLMLKFKFIHPAKRFLSQFLEDEQFVIYKAPRTDKPPT